MVDSSQHANIEIYAYSEIEEVSGFVGNFEVKIRKKARLIDTTKCTGCGVCIDKCLTTVEGASEWDLGLGPRKAIYRPYAQAVPSYPVIDKEYCGHFTTGLCSVCEKVCEAHAIDYDQEDEIIEDKFGAIVAATGYRLFDPSVYGEYGGGRFKDVITSLQLERLINPSGPTLGHIVRPSDFREPKTVVFIQCVGSRDEEKGVPYCSSICCMYTAKHAILLKEHIPDVQTFVFYIDIRATGKNYEQFVLKAIEEYGTIYLRGRVSRIYERGDKLIVKGADTLSGSQIEIEADLVVLATAVIPQGDAGEMARLLGIPHDEYNFFTELHPKLAPLETVSTGIYLAGACQGPRDVPESVMSGSGAAAKVGAMFSQDRLSIEPLVSFIDVSTCSLCKSCESVCPYGAIQEEEITLRDGSKKRQMKVVESICRGCGLCVATCSSGSIMLKGATDEQVYAQIEALALG